MSNLLGYSFFLRELITPDSDFWKPVEKPTPALVGSDRGSILRHLEKTSPETIALAFEWEDTATSIIKTEKKLAGYVSFLLMFH